MDRLTSLAPGLVGLMYVHVRAEAGRVALPDMCCDIIWLNERLMLAGPTSRGHAIEAGADFQLVNVEPLALRDLLGIPLDELTDQCVPLADLLPRLDGPLSELFFHGRAAELVAPSPPPERNARMARAARLIRDGRGIRRAADDTAFSERQLERRFKDGFGLSPRRFRRIMRLRHAVELAKNGESLSGAAAIAGFADQPHFTREAQALMGRSPAALLPNVGKVQDSVVATREY